MNEKPIYVTQPSLPPLQDFLPYLEEIWQSKVLTNGGPFHQKLEEVLCGFLKVDYISLFNNGTNALLTALQALELGEGEVITTPFTFIASTNCLLWNGLSPVFVDIDPNTLNLDPKKIVAAIGPKTKAIMPVHCYGNPCAVEAIEAIAAEHGLKVIYDAAHAFGQELQEGPLLQYGDLAVLSFHATKVFNTLEGGAIVSHSLAMKQKIDQLKNFGIINEVEMNGFAGLNGKMNELQAALGLVQLQALPEAFSKRKQADAYYRRALKNIPGLRPVLVQDLAFSNHAYFPVLVDSPYPLSRDALYQKLQAANIYTRRYFYPLMSNLPLYAHLASAKAANLPVANHCADKVLCLPMYAGLREEELQRITNTIKEA